MMRLLFSALLLSLCFVYLEAQKLDENGMPIEEEEGDEDEVAWMPMQQEILPVGGQNPIPGEGDDMMSLMAELRILSSGTKNQSTEANSQAANLLFDGDILLDVGTVKALTKAIKEKTDENGANNDQDRRKKRSIESLLRKRRRATKFAYYRWDNPKDIGYRFDGTNTPKERTIIKQALDMYHKHTCLRFREIPINDVQTHHIMFSKRTGCWSPIGIRRNSNYQTLSIGKGCAKPAIVAHEVGHSLGFFHEQARPDREQNIRLIKKNIQGTYVDQFEISNYIDAKNVPYDVTSIMHYSGQAYSSNKEITMKSIDPLRQQGMGQLDVFSWGDIVLLNSVYCAGNCPRKLPRNCQNNGIQDPNACDRCKCPPGFAGTYCRDIASGVVQTCGGTLFVRANQQVSIESPGYSERRKYLPGTECAWKITTDGGYRLRLEFQEGFDVHCTWWSKECIHDWVDVKTDKQNFGFSGYRFCCKGKPSYVVRSEGNEIMVIFHSSARSSKGDKQGFSAKIKSEYNPGTQGNFEGEVQNGTTPSPSSSPITNVTVQSKDPETSISVAQTSSTTANMLNEISGKCGACDVGPGIQQHACRKENQKYCCKGVEEMLGIDGKVEFCVIPKWKEWSDWGTCSASCGGCGKQLRSREGEMPYGPARVQEENRSCGSKACKPRSCIPSYCKLAGFSSRVECVRKCPLCCDGYEPKDGKCIKK